MCERYYDFSKQTVRVGTEQFPRHSEASIIERNDSSLLMAWQHHTKSAVSDCSDQLPSDISMAESYDEGKTWVNERVVVDMKHGCVNVYSPSVLRNTDGSISLYFMRYMRLEK